MVMNGTTWWLLVACTSTLLLPMLVQRNRSNGRAPWNAFCWMLLSLIPCSGGRLLKVGVSPDSVVSLLGQPILQIASMGCLLMFLQEYTKEYTKQRKTS